jgi:hypothetical protein
LLPTPAGPCYYGEQEAKIMPNRPDPTPDVPLSPEELAQLRQQYERLSRPSLQQVYSDTLERCKLDRQGRPPRADQFQVLVTAWRVLRGQRR